jgi:hypothetical protein
LKKSVKTLIIVVITTVLLWQILAFFALLFFAFPTRTVQVLYSPDGKQKAVLKRMDGIDLVFYVKVNGRKVYSSPDFAPNHKVDFRERLVWDKSGTIVVLEVIG